MADNLTPNLLLADADKRCLEAFQSYFTKSGWNCDVAGDPHALLNATSSKSYDIVITDLDIPGIDTLDFLKSLRKEKPSQAVIVLTGECSVRDAVDFMKEGAVDFLQKPIDMFMLEQTIRNAINSLRQSEVDHGIYRFVQSDTISYELTSSQLAGVKFPLALADRLHRANLISLNTKLELTLAFQEALTNSLDHGNLELESVWKDEIDSDHIDKYSLVKKERLQIPKFADRKIRIHTSYDPQKFTIIIEDEGKGFLSDKETVVKQSSVSLKGYGRGMAIMFVSMDEVVYSDRGTQIKLVKYLNR
jgi:DNA-binding response OmpR family regulator